MHDHDDAPSVAYANLQPEQIIAALEDLEYRCDGRFLALNSYENRVYQIGIEDAAPVVAKFYRPARWSDAEILEEHEFALQLAAGELPFVAPVRHAGATLLKSGPFRFAVYPNRGGRAPDLDDYELLRQLGGLPAPVLVEIDVGVALDARGVVPGGFSMAHGEDACDLQLMSWNGFGRGDRPCFCSHEL